MDVEWDDVKRQATLAKHGVDLLVAARIFEGRTLDKRDDRADYGEIRTVSPGMVGEECYIVVHTMRQGRLRLITAWKGGLRDRQRYAASLARRTQGDG
ncbi:BrnT family toxin [Jiella flava]|uniref:BrnT family toxin n=1 Tax=Jiella flava TaxID=2816857 RepID=A0A939FTJ7_9HYPH|nr:BrnT family toxin [Jiella flava]